MAGQARYNAAILDALVVRCGLESDRKRSVVMTDAGADYPTTIGADANFKGRLEFEKGARLLGKFEGEVKTKGELELAAAAQIGRAHV